MVGYGGCSAIPYADALFKASLHTHEKVSYVGRRVAQKSSAGPLNIGARKGAGRFGRREIQGGCHGAFLYEMVREEFILVLCPKRRLRGGVVGVRREIFHHL